MPPHSRTSASQQLATAGASHAAANCDSNYGTYDPTSTAIGASDQANTNPAINATTLIPTAAGNCDGTGDPYGHMRVRYSGADRTGRLDDPGGSALKAYADDGTTIAGPVVGAARCFVVAQDVRWLFARVAARRHPAVPVFGHREVRHAGVEVAVVGRVAAR